MAEKNFKKYVSEPIRKEYNKNRSRDLYEDINQTTNIVRNIFKRNKEGSTLDTSWCSHTYGINQDLGRFRVITKA